MARKLRHCTGRDLRLSSCSAALLANNSQVAQPAAACITYVLMTRLTRSAFRNTRLRQQEQSQNRYMRLLYHAASQPHLFWFALRTRPLILLCLFLGCLARTDGLAKGRLRD